MVATKFRPAKIVIERLSAESLLYRCRFNSIGQAAFIDVKIIAMVTHRQVHVFRALPEGLVLLAQVLVHFHVASCLTHHPDRRSLHGLATQRPNHQRV